MISDNGKTYTYDGLNQLRSVKQGVDIIATYEYNALSQRVVKKTPDGGTTVFVYSSVTGQLLEEYNKQTKVKRDYIYAEGKLIAFIENNILVYVITDHLNAPQMLLDSTGRNIWSATYDAFGKATITATNNMKLNLRADGQYEDSETGLYYNWYRYYNPSLGRYITSNRLQ
jgi:RHS repeat-associated protein